MAHRRGLTTSDSWREDAQALVIRPLIAEAVSTQVSSVVTTNSNTTRFSVVNTDPVATWTAEATEINPSDADLDELVIQPKKLAGLSILSNELAADSDPSALELVGQGLVRDLSSRIDSAFFGSAVSDGPGGLEALAGVTAVTGGSITNLDAFAEAISEAETVGQQVTGWVAHPDTVLTLMKLKDETVSARSLLGPDATSPTKKSVLGIPLFGAPGCSPSHVWGVPRATSFVVIRLPATVEVDRSVKFTSDQTAVRCVLRVGSGWPHPASVIRIGLGGSQQPAAAAGPLLAALRGPGPADASAPTPHQQRSANPYPTQDVRSPRLRQPRRRRRAVLRRAQTRALRIGEAHRHTAIP